MEQNMAKNRELRHTGEWSFIQQIFPKFKKEIVELKVESEPEMKREIPQNLDVKIKNEIEINEVPINLNLKSLKNGNVKVGGETEVKWETLKSLNVEIKNEIEINEVPIDFNLKSLKNGNVRVEGETEVKGEILWSPNVEIKNEIEINEEPIDFDLKSLYGRPKIILKEKNQSPSIQYKHFKENCMPIKKIRVWTRETVSSQYDMNFPQNCMLINPLVAYTGEDQHQYNQSNQALSDTRHLLRHARKHSRKISYHCSKCEKTFLTSSNFEIHFKTHIEEKPYQCNQCDKAFIHKSHLIEHMITHTGEKPYLCSQCDKTISQNSLLIAHPRTDTCEKLYKCSQCEKLYSSNFNHNILLGINSGEKPYQRKVCDNKNSQRCNFNTHMRGPTGGEPHQCTICAKSFFYKLDLKRHLSTHTETGMKWNELSYQTQFPDFLKPYQSKVCDNKNSQKNHFKTNMRGPTGEEPHQCTLCAKTFFYKLDLKRHLSTHTETGMKRNELSYQTQFQDFLKG